MKIRRIVPLVIRNIFRRLVGLPPKIPVYHFHYNLGNGPRNLRTPAEIWNTPRMARPNIWESKRVERPNIWETNGAEPHSIWDNPDLVEAAQKMAAFQYVETQNNQVNVYPDELNLEIEDWNPKEAVNTELKKKARTRVTQLTHLAHDNGATPAEAKQAEKMARKIAETYSIEIPKELRDY